uniref:Uncharacterized protein n=1 Tax=Anguilla anguilla TaxID=7936 RepID=A0A0E9WR32_ANGAN
MTEAQVRLLHCIFRCRRSRVKEEGRLCRAVGVTWTAEVVTPGSGLPQTARFSPLLKMSILT